MSTYKLYTGVLSLVLGLVLTACGRGGTETGTTEPIDLLTLGARVEAAGAALVPDMDSSGDSSGSVSAKDISYLSADDWSAYLEGNNTMILTDIFGPAGGHPAPDTRIRVMLSRFKETLDAVFASDPGLTCAGRFYLEEGDVLEIPFYGEISNGTSDDRYFDCIAIDDDIESGNNYYLQRYIYGRDAGGVIRVVYISDSAGENIYDIDERGNYAINRLVTYIVYAEALETEGRAAYLDFNRVQTIVYNGDDSQFDTADDLIHKNRSRISGRVTLDESDNPLVGSGDFSVIKYDRSYDGISTRISITQSLGRGSYDDGDYSLFNIDSNAGTDVEDKAGIYCIQSVTGALPVYAESENCTPFEGTATWTGYELPFAFLPPIEEDFGSKTFFEPNDTDLISDSGGNFTIPEYQVSSAGGAE